MLQIFTTPPFDQIPEVYSRLPLGSLFDMGRTVLDKIEFLFQWVAVLSFAGIIFCVVRIRELAKEEAKKYVSINVVTESRMPGEVEWEKIRQLAQSEIQDDWKHAIIRADTVLTEIVDRMVHNGAPLADRMARIEPSDFRTLPEAREAHAVRESLDRADGALDLSQDEAKRVLGLYAQVFQEFGYL